MAYYSVRDFAELKKSMIAKQREIMVAISSKKSIPTNRVKQWVEELVDSVLTFDSSSAPSMQPFVKLMAIDLADDYKKASAHDSPQASPDVTTKNIDNNEDIVWDTNEESTVDGRYNTNGGTLGNKSSDDKTTDKTSNDNKSSDESDKGETRGQVRFKGVIRGIDSIIRDDDNRDKDQDWETHDKRPNKRSKTASSRKTRAQSKSPNKKSTESKTPSTSDWSSEGKVLGGETSAVETISELSNEERRRLLAEKSEQRMKQMNTRGAKGEIKLPSSAPADRGDCSDFDHNSGLKWRI